MSELRIDPISCVAHGMCAELLPERIWLDDWGYPVLDAEPLTPELEAHARRAAAACPVFALRLQRGSRPAGRDPRGSVGRERTDSGLTRA